MINSANKKRKILSAVVLCLGLSLSSASTSYAGLPAFLNPMNSEAQPVPSLAPMLEKVLPSVVSIKVEGTAKIQSNIPEEFRRFFGYDGEQERAFSAQGSGVIIDADKGYIVTNNHVIENANSITVVLNSGKHFTAKLIGRDPQTDIALLQIKSDTKLTAIAMADSDRLRVGDFALAIGNPFGIGQTVTSGIVSALARSGFNATGFENFIQTDASINRGNSGGALINIKGELIGINTAIIAPSGGSVGIGFAIPSNMVKSLTKQLSDYGEVRRGLLGIKGSELTSDIAKAFDINVEKGAFVSEVIPNSAAAVAGIKAGDVIVSINGKPIASFAELRAKIATIGAGTQVELGLIRDGKPLTLSTKLKSSDEAVTETQLIHPALQGAHLRNSEVNGEKGVLVDSVDPNSTAARVALQKGDLIIGVNRVRVNTIAELRKAIDNKPSAIALSILRGNSHVYILLN